MGKRMIAMAGVFILILLVSACTLLSSVVAEVERISSKQLLEMLGHSEVIVVDVRSKSDWNKSETKIKGAVRENLGNISSWIDKYPKGKTLVFYCA